MIYGIQDMGTCNVLGPCGAFETPVCVCVCARVHVCVCMHVCVCKCARAICQNKLQQPKKWRKSDNRKCSRGTGTEERKRQQ